MCKLKKLERLYLDENNIGDKGLKYFSSSLSEGVLNELKVLDLGLNLITDIGIKFLLDPWSQGILSNLDNLYLHSNDISDVCGHILSMEALDKLEIPFAIR